MFLVIFGIRFDVRHSFIFTNILAALFISQNIWQVPLLAFILGLSIIAHELGHLLVSRHLTGYREGKIVLTFWGGLAQVASGGPKTMAAISIAGPIVNIILAVIAFALAILLSALGLTGSILYICQMTALINAIIGVFNMLPVRPFDGGKLTESMLWMIYKEPDEIKISKILSRISLITGIVLTTLSFCLGIPEIAIIAILVFIFSAIYIWLDMTKGRHNGKL